jgi:dienelactone hydrolase
MTAIFFGLLAFAIGIFLLPYWIISANPFPQPSGQWKVGASNLVWHELNAQTEMAHSQPGRIAKIWYPTDAKTGIVSPYIDDIDRTLSFFTAGQNPLYQLLLNKRYFGRIQTPALVGALPATSSMGLPVVLFSPGFGGINFINTFYALEFASRGFIVVGINHPGSSGITLLDNGAAVGIKEQYKVLSKIGTPDPNFDALANEIILQQASNISMVLDEVIKLNSDANSWLYQKIDTHQIFGAGHSAGGAASFAACEQDQRILKAVNFDGYIKDPIDMNDLDRPLLLILSDRETYPKNRQIREQIAELYAQDADRRNRLASQANLTQLSLPAVGHLDFSDVALLVPQLAKVTGLAGDVDGRELLSNTSAIAINFFNEMID